MFVINVEGAIERDGQYLMIVRGANEGHAPGVLSFPGGKVERTDGPENALESTLRREILEELGIEVSEKMTYVESRLFDMDDGSKVLNVLFLCHLRTGVPIVGYEEVQSVHWMTPEHILNGAPPWIKQSTLQGIEEARQRTAA